MAGDTNRPPFWTTLPGVVIAVAGLIVIIGALAAGLAASGIMQSSPSSPTTVITPVPPSEKIIFVRKWGTRSTGDGQFRLPKGVAVDGSGSVFVVDHDNHRVQKFGPEGEFLTKWGTFGEGDGEFNGPHAIAVDEAGNVYVSDGDNNRVQKFSSDGEFLTKWGLHGRGDGTVQKS